MRIEGATALVTGGAKGLGLCIAMHLQELGARVVVADLDDQALKALPESISRHRCDITVQEQARGMVSAIGASHGAIDILVNNAGLIYSEPFVNIMQPDALMHDYERFRRCITANLDSVFVMTSAVVEAMVLKRTKGAVVNVSSISARGNEGQTAYAAAKAGVEAMTVTWSKELGRLGIRCNAVAPGFIDTPSTRAALSEANIKHVVSNTPLRRMGQATEVAKAVASLIDNDFLNGVVLDVNGGLAI